MTYRRHRAGCKHRARRYTKCFCPIWVQGVLDGEPIRRSLDLTGWEAAQRKVRDLEIYGEKESVSVADACKKFLRRLRSPKAEPWNNKKI